jgi:hypothetical protein
LITDEDYRRFIQYMKVIRHNMYKVTKTTVWFIIIVLLNSKLWKIKIFKWQLNYFLYLW